MRAGPGGHLLSLPCSSNAPRHGAGTRGTAPRGFCGQSRSTALAPLPPALPLSQAPPEASLRPPSPQSHSPPACTRDTLAAWAGLAHHIHTRQPRLQPSARTASGPQCPPVLATRQGGAETSRAEGPPSPLGDHTAGRENAQKPCEMAVNT